MAGVCIHILVPSGVQWNALRADEADIRQTNDKDYYHQHSQCSLNPVVSEGPLVQEQY